MFSLTRPSFRLQLSVIIFLLVAGFVSTQASAQKLTEIGSFILSDAEFNDQYSVKVSWDQRSSVAQNVLPKTFDRGSSRFVGREYPAMIEIKGLGKNRVKARFPGKINAFFFFIDRTTGVFKKKRIYETTCFNISWITPEPLLAKGLDKIMGIFGSWRYIPAAAAYADRKWYWTAAGFDEKDSDNVRAIGAISVNDWQFSFLRERGPGYGEYTYPTRKFEVSQKINMKEWIPSIQ